MKVQELFTACECCPGDADGRWRDEDEGRTRPCRNKCGNSFHESLQSWSSKGVAQIPRLTHRPTRRSDGQAWKEGLSREKDFQKDSGEKDGAWGFHLTKRSCRCMERAEPLRVHLGRYKGLKSTGGGRYGIIRLTKREGQSLSDVHLPNAETQAANKPASPSSNVKRR